MNTFHRACCSILALSLHAGSARAGVDELSAGASGSRITCAPLSDDAMRQKAASLISEEGATIKINDVKFVVRDGVVVKCEKS